MTRDQTRELERRVERLEADCRGLRAELLVQRFRAAGVSSYRMVFSGRHISLAELIERTRRSSDDELAILERQIGPELAALENRPRKETP